jgi:hypothetical protein
MKKIIDAKRLCLAFALTATAAFTNARELPHADLVKKQLQGGHYKQVVGNCTGTYMTAPPASAGREVECWAASTASAIDKQPQPVSAMILNESARESTLSRCRTLSMEQRFKSTECEAAMRADTFISLRLPRASRTLKPVEFK